MNNINLEILQHVNWFDVVVFFVILRGIYVGFKNFLTPELFNFAGILLSLILGVYWYSQVADVLITNFNLPAWLSQLICFTVIVQLARVIVRYAVMLLLKVLNIQFLPQLEKIGGAILGIGRGVIVAGIILLTLSFIPSSYLTESIYGKSYSGVFILQATERTYKALTFWLPEEKQDKEIFLMPATETKGKIKLPAKK
jgi:uncharacterized membrane protein required for colicin V production